MRDTLLAQEDPEELHSAEVLFLLWMALQRRLKTADRLKFLNISQVCILCNTFNETNNHLFFECNATKVIWSMIKEWLKIRIQMTSIPCSIK